MQLHTYATRTEASIAVAKVLTTALSRQLAAQATASLVVSGGSTPLECFSSLSQQRLDWGRVQVTLSDERCVPVEHPDSNAKMLRQNLLVDAAATASYLPPDQPLPEPFAAVLLGMGADGHFASLFPDAANLPAGLDIDQTALTLDVQTVASPHPRISMPMARLLRTECLVLLIFGDDKKAIIDQVGNLPIHSLLAQSRTPIHIYWAP